MFQLLVWYSKNEPTYPILFKPQLTENACIRELEDFVSEIYCHFDHRNKFVALTQIGVDEMIFILEQHNIRSIRYKIFRSDSDYDG